MVQYFDSKNPTVVQATQLFLPLAGSPAHFTLKRHLAWHYQIPNTTDPLRTT